MSDKNMLHVMICREIDSKKRYSGIRNLNDLFSNFSECFNIDYDDFASHSRLNEKVLLRSIFTHYAVKLLPVTLSEIGKFCKRDHTSILYLKNKVSKNIEIGYTDVIGKIDQFENYLIKKSNINTKYVHHLIHTENKFG